jgi:hypothetical protein
VSEDPERLGRPLDVLVDVGASAQRDGYCARIDGFLGQGEGVSPQDAVDDLARLLRDAVARWDAQADEYARAREVLDRINRYEEPELIAWARARLLEGSLEGELRRAARRTVRRGEEPQA